MRQPFAISFESQRFALDMQVELDALHLRSGINGSQGALGNLGSVQALVA